MYSMYTDTIYSILYLFGPSPDDDLSFRILLARVQSVTIARLSYNIIILGIIIYVHIITAVAITAAV